MNMPFGAKIFPDQRRSRNNLALLLRDSFHENLIRDWFVMILSGRNPIIVVDKRCTEQGCLRVVEDPIDRMAPSAERRDQAMKELLNRRDGLPAQRVQLEAEIRATQTHAVVTPTELAGLSPRALGAVVNTLRGALLPAGSAIDTVATETKKP